MERHHHHEERHLMMLGASCHGVLQTPVGLQYVQSFTTTYFSAPLRSSLYTQPIHWIVPSLPAQPFSPNFPLQQQPDPQGTAKITAKCRLEFLLLEAGPDSQGGQRCIHSSLENPHSPCGLLCCV